MATYPARRGVIHTLQWKGLADGLTDLRYLATLDSAIASAESSSEPEMRERASAARRRLDDQLDKFHWTDVDILSETSAQPFSDSDANDVTAIREIVVDELKELRRGAAVQH
jgi:hypothetical protein